MDVLLDHAVISAAKTGVAWRINRWGAFVAGAPVRSGDFCALVHRERGAVLAVNSVEGGPQAVGVTPGTTPPLPAWWQLVPAVDRPGATDV